VRTEFAGVFVHVGASKRKEKTAMWELAGCSCGC
jgi:hypothetical protein